MTPLIYLSEDRDSGLAYFQQESQLWIACESRREFLSVPRTFSIYRAEAVQQLSFFQRPNEGFETLQAPTPEEYGVYHSAPTNQWLFYCPNGLLLCHSAHCDKQQTLYHHATSGDALAAFLQNY